MLTQMGKVIEKKPQSIHKKRESKFVVGIDSRGNSIQKRDIVNVVDGVHVPDRQGEIRHIYKNYAFLYSRMCLENGGIFVCKTNHLELAGGGTGPGGVGGPSPRGGGGGYMSPRLSSPMHPSSGGGGQGQQGQQGGANVPGSSRECKFTYIMFSLLIDWLIKCFAFSRSSKHLIRRPFTPRPRTHKRHTRNANSPTPQPRPHRSDYQDHTRPLQRKHRYRQRCHRHYSSCGTSL